MSNEKYVKLSIPEINAFINLHKQFEKYAEKHGFKIKKRPKEFINPLPLVSSKGRNFKNEPLTENNLRAGTKVIWQNNVYKTGNRKNTVVELFQDGKFIRTCSMRQIRLVKNQK